MKSIKLSAGLLYRKAPKAMYLWVCNLYVLMFKGWEGNDQYIFGIKFSFSFSISLAEQNNLNCKKNSTMINDTLGV